jgi:hypothetical protein
VGHFTNSKNNCSRDKKDKSIYEGLLKKITTVEFVLDSGLMCGALQELSELSLELQKRNINLYSANNKIKRLTQVFEDRRVYPTQYYKISPTAANCLNFQGVRIYKKTVKSVYKSVQINFMRT